MTELKNYSRNLHGNKRIENKRPDYDSKQNQVGTAFCPAGGGRHEAGNSTPHRRSSQLGTHAPRCPQGRPPITPKEPGRRLQEMLGVTRDHIPRSLVGNRIRKLYREMLPDVKGHLQLHVLNRRHRIRRLLTWVSRLRPVDAVWSCVPANACHGAHTYTSLCCCCF